MAFELAPLSEAGAAFVAAAEGLIAPLRERAGAADRSGTMNEDNFADLKAAGLLGTQQDRAAPTGARKAQDIGKGYGRNSIPARHDTGQPMGCTVFCVCASAACIGICQRPGG